MRTVRTVVELRAALNGARREARTIGLVPTMGALHEGHLALIRRAREDCSVVVVSLFVNPRQFDDAGDLAAYPRDEGGDAALAAEAGADLLYAPPAEEVYPAGFATTVHVEGPAAGFESDSRGTGHFDGVATVVTKLFNAVGPQVAYFGEKDAQQVAVIRRLVRDLDMPVRIDTVATVREPDGLALSSRNVRLGPADRPRALALRHGLDAAEAAIAAGESDPDAVAAAARRPMRALDVEPDYVALVHPDSFEPVGAIDGQVLVAVAARVGDVRLIDNQLVRRSSPPTSQPTKR